MASQGKILITGASSGVGKALALRLAKHAGMGDPSKFNKFGLHLCGRDGGRLTEVQTACTELAPGATITTSVGDLRQASAAEQMWKEYVDAHGEAIDCAVANAGINRPGAVGDNSEKEYDIVMDTNLKAAWFLFSKAAPVMKKQGSGQLVATNSVRALRGAPLAGLYTASKFGLKGLMQCMRYECKPHGVKVGAVLPGGISTPWWKDSTRGGRKPLTSEEEDKLFPQFLTADAVAEVIHTGLIDQPESADIDEIVLSQAPPYEL